VHLQQQDGTTSKLLTASITRGFSWMQANLYASAYADRGDNKSLGFFAGLSFPIRDGLYGSVGATSSRRQRGALTAEVAKSQTQVDDSWGGRLRGSVGQNTSGQADLSYRSGYGQVSGSVIQDRYSTLATAQIDGSLAVMGGGVFLGNKVDTAFAVVDAGAPGVTVTQDNNPIGKTNFMGKFLVPNLRPWESNRLGIDPYGMSVNFDSAKVAEVTAPRGNSGVYVNFGGRTNVISGIVVFVGADGKPLQAGYKGHLEGKNDIFLVGHDGRAYVKDLSSSNVAIIDMLDKECRASFAFTPQPGRQGIVRGVTCQ
jgi:outer membrane usher protein